MARRQASALELATRALAHRDLSERGLHERLARSGVTEDEIEQTLGELRRAGALDDSRFASSRAGALAERGKGDAAIRFDLERQGLGGEAIEDALAQLEPELQRLERILQRRGATASTARLLSGRGFEEEAIRAAVARAGRAELGYEGFT
jgi:SOS response regulatory protein OraA/RecX